MKIYYHAGLLELTKASGHGRETLTSLQKRTKFKRTHHFLFQVWQAIYNIYSHPESLHPTEISKTTLTFGNC